MNWSFCWARLWALLLSSLFFGRCVVDAYPTVTFYNEGPDALNAGQFSVVWRRADTLEVQTLQHSTPSVGTFSIPAGGSVQLLLTVGAKPLDIWIARNNAGPAATWTDLVSCEQGYWCGTPVSVSFTHSNGWINAIPPSTNWCFRGSIRNSKATTCAWTLGYYNAGNWVQVANGSLWPLSSTSVVYCPENANERPALFVRSECLDAMTGTNTTVPLADGWNANGSEVNEAAAVDLSNAAGNYGFAEPADMYGTNFSPGGDYAKDDTLRKVGTQLHTDLMDIGGMTLLELANSGMTQEQIHDRLVSLNAGVGEVKAVIQSGNTLLAAIDAKSAFVGQQASNILNEITRQAGTGALMTNLMTDDLRIGMAISNGLGQAQQTLVGSSNMMRELRDRAGELPQIKDKLEFIRVNELAAQNYMLATMQQDLGNAETKLGGIQAQDANHYAQVEARLEQIRSAVTNAVAAGWDASRGIWNQTNAFEALNRTLTNQANAVAKSFGEDIANLGAAISNSLSGDSLADIAAHTKAATNLLDPVSGVAEIAISNAPGVFGGRDTIRQFTNYESASAFVSPYIEGFKSESASFRSALGNVSATTWKPGAPEALLVSLGPVGSINLAFWQQAWFLDLAALSNRILSFLLVAWFLYKTCVYTWEWLHGVMSSQGSKVPNVDIAGFNVGAALWLGLIVTLMVAFQVALAVGPAYLFGGLEWIPRLASNPFTASTRSVSDGVWLVFEFVPVALAVQLFVTHMVNRYLMMEFYLVAAAIVRVLPV